MSKKTQGRIEITIWAISILFGIATAIYTGINGKGIGTALVFGILGVIAFMGIALMIYLTIYTRLTL